MHGRRNVQVTVSAATAKLYFERVETLTVSNTNERVGLNRVVRNSRDGCVIRVVRGANADRTREGKREAEPTHVTSVRDQIVTVEE